MLRVIFVCLGNICRSPMGELILKSMVAEKNLAGEVEVDSFGTSDWEVGNPVYPPIQTILREHGIVGSHRAKQLTKYEVMNADYVLVMDSSNLIDVLRIAGAEHSGKIYKLCSFTDNPRDVADPWYTRNFEKAYSDVSDGCKCFLDYIIKKHNLMSQKCCPVYCGGGGLSRGQRCFITLLYIQNVISVVVVEVYVAIFVKGAGGV